MALSELSMPRHNIASRLLDRAGYCLDCGLSLLLTGAEAAVQRPHVITVYFHGVMHEPADGFVDPQEGMTPGFLREFVRLMTGGGYTFVTPDAILGPNRPEGNLAILSTAMMVIEACRGNCRSLRNRLFPSPSF